MHSIYNMKKAALLGFWFIAASVLGQEVGSYGFLKMPVSAHAAALGGPVISIVETDASLVSHNPSLLCPEMQGQASVSYMQYADGINLGAASYTGKFLDYGAWQASAHYVNYGSFNGYDEYGNSTGTFGAHDVALSWGVGYPLTQRWRIGAAARAILSNYESYNAFAVGVDVGLNYYNEVDGRSISIAVTNLGRQLKAFNDERRVSMPTQLSIGVSKEVEHLPFCLTLTAIDLFDWHQHYRDGVGSEHKYSGGEQALCHLLLGVEWLPTDGFFLGAAYNYRRQREFSGAGGFLRGMSYGGGIQHNAWRFSAAYARYSAVDGTLHITLNYSFQ